MAGVAMTSASSGPVVCHLAVSVAHASEPPADREASAVNPWRHVQARREAGVGRLVVASARAQEGPRTESGAQHGDTHGDVAHGILTIDSFVVFAQLDFIGDNRVVGVLSVASGQQVEQARGGQSRAAANIQADGKQIGRWRDGGGFAYGVDRPLLLLVDDLALVGDDLALCGDLLEIHHRPPAALVIAAEFALTSSAVMPLSAVTQKSSNSLGSGGHLFGIARDDAAKVSWAVGRTVVRWPDGKAPQVYPVQTPLGGQTLRGVVVVDGGLRAIGGSGDGLLLAAGAALADAKWHKVDFGGYDVLYGLTAHPDGSVIAVGRTAGTGFIASLEPIAGTVKWKRALSGDVTAWPVAVRNANSGHFAMTGVRYVDGKRRGWIIKTDGDGKLCQLEACKSAADCADGRACTAKTFTACDDTNACTADSCEPAKGCVTTPTLCVAGTAPAGMVLVPAGSTWNGCHRAVQKSCPTSNQVHKLWLKAYWIDTREVSVADYEKCMAAGKCAAPDPWAKNSIAKWRNYQRTGAANHPVNAIDLSRARAYCTWAGKRLPSRYEWQKAARGGCEQHAGADCRLDTPVHAWGNAPPTCATANVGTPTPGCGTGQTVPVDARPKGASKYGLLGTGGNVREWLQDGYDSSTFKSLPARAPKASADPADGSHLVAGGGYEGAFSSGAANSVMARKESEKWAQVGLRCAKGPE